MCVKRLLNLLDFETYFKNFTFQPKVGLNSFELFSNTCHDYIGFQMTKYKQIYIFNAFFSSFDYIFAHTTFFVEMKQKNIYINAHELSFMLG